MRVDTNNTFSVMDRRNKTLIMDEDSFEKFSEALLPYYNYVEIGISLFHINKIIRPMWGLHILNWNDRTFVIADNAKYVEFCLKVL